MGALCPRQNLEVISLEQNINEIKIDTQAEIESLMNQETNYKVSLSHNFQFDDASLEYCEQVIQQIFSISITHMITQFSQQLAILKFQILKPIQELAHNTIDFNQDLLKILIDYYEFLSYVQEQCARKVITWWKEPKCIVDVEKAIAHWTQTFIIFGGKLRRQKASMQLISEPKGPERFVKTREWIKRQTEGQSNDEIQLSKQEIAERFVKAHQ